MENHEIRQAETPPKKKKCGLWVAIIVAACLLLAGSAGGFLWAKGFFLSTHKPPPVAYFAQGDVTALRLPAPQEEINETTLRAYFSEALNYAEQNGYNTLLFEAKSGLPVWWRDKNFPTASQVTAEDSLFAKLDPLALLCEEAAGRNIQLWVLADPYRADGAPEEARGKATRLAQAQEGTYFSPADETYRKMLAESLAVLPQKYPIAGVVLTGFGVSAQNPVSDITAWQQGFLSLSTEISDGLARYSPAAGLHIDFNSASTLFSAVFTAQLQEAGVGYLLPTFSRGPLDTEKLAAYGQKENSLVIITQPGEDHAALALFTAASAPYYAGVQLGTWPSAATQTAELGFLASALTPADAPLPKGFTLPHTLQVNFPTSSDVIDTSWEQVYVMGNSNPAESLLLNGAEVARGGVEGTFGVLVPLEYGENKLLFTQGETTLEHIITRPLPPPVTPAEEEAPLYSDGTLEAQPGQAVQMVATFTGGLAQPGNDATINETYYKGATGVVQSSVPTPRWNTARGVMQQSWDYLLTNGDYVSAQNCVWIEGDGHSAFTGLSAEADEKYRGEWLHFEGTGTPAANFSCENNRLSLTFYNTSFTLPGAFSSQLVKSAEVETLENAVVLHLDTQNLWGYQIDYTDGVTRLFLKRAPKRSDDATRPLTSVRIMLDPGHGADDIGAPGIMGALGPNEKDLNLAQAQAIRYRLQQLGAEVIMIHEDTDTFYPTQERLVMQMEEKPDFFLAVHHNSDPMTIDHSNTVGMQGFYYIPSGYSAPLSAQFAQNIMDGVALATGRPASAPAWGYFNVIRTPVCPSILFEYAFMISPADFENAASTAGLYGAACGTAEGIFASLPSADAR